MRGQIRNSLKVRIAEKELRDGQRYTYRTINDLTGVATSTLSDWATGNVRLIAADTLAALCAWLECQPGDLLQYIPPAQPSGQDQAKVKVKPKKKTR